MSSKTKIVVLHMKELIYTGIFTVLGILFIVLLLIMFFPKKDNSPSSTSPKKEQSTDNTLAPTSSDALYIPGIYSTELILGGQTVEVEVIVDESAITSIELIHLDDAITTMYPLLEPTLESLSEQIYASQSLEEITYSSENKYTSLVLLEAIRTSLNKACDTK